MNSITTRSSRIVRQRAKEKTKSLMSGITFHGMPKLVRKQHFLITAAWLLLILASVTYCSYSLANDFIHYLHYEVVIDSEIVYEDHPEFPQITVCGMTNFTCVHNNHSCPEIFLEFENQECKAINPRLSLINGTGEIMKAIEPGYQKGVHITLNSKAIDDHLTVYISNQSEKIKYNKGIVIPSIGETSLVLDREIEERLQEPYSNCKSDYTFELGENESLRQATFTYYETECYSLCKIRKIFEACERLEDYESNFKLYFTDHDLFENNYDELVRTCMGLDSELIASVEKQFSTLGEHKICEEICPFPCHEIRYTVLPYANNYKYEFGKVNIFYRTFKHTKIIHIPKTSFEEMLGLIGGTFGFFMGCSLISFLELSEIFVNCFAIFCFAKKKNVENNEKVLYFEPGQKIANQIV